MDCPIEPSWEKHFLHPEPSLLPSWLKSSTNRTMFEFGAVWSCWELLGLRQGCHNNAATTMQSVHSAFSLTVRQWMIWSWWTLPRQQICWKTGLLNEDNGTVCHTTGASPSGQLLCLRIWASQCQNPTDFDLHWSRNHLPTCPPVELPIY